jgi:O-antigen/teichoic acid export membrane protein
MATIFSQAMIQSLVPAFSQLQAPEKLTDLQDLFARGVRLTLIWILPALMVLFVIAKPFFTIWAGEEFGRESSLPLYILLFGLLFGVISFIPYSATLAAGRSDVFAKLYWVELALYAAPAAALITKYQIAGAAAAYSIRVVIDSSVLILLSKRTAGVGLKLFDYLGRMVIGGLILLPPIIYALGYNSFSLWLVPVTSACLVLYAVFVWSRLVDADEKVWITARFKTAITRCLIRARVAGR